MTSSNPAQGPHRAQPADTDDGIFLTPRVVDQTAFMRYTEALRGLIDEASAKSRSLQQSAGSAEESVGTVREVLEELRTKMETAVRLIPTLDQRAEQARAVVGELGDFGSLRDELASAFETKLDEIVQARMAEATAEIDRRAHESVERAQQASSRVEAAAQRLESMADEAETRVQERIAQLEGEAGQAEARSIDKAAQLERTAASLESKVAELLGRLEDTTAEIETASGSVSQLDARTGEAKAAVDGLTERAEAIIAEAGLERVEAIRDDAHRSAAILSDTITRAEAMADRSHEDSLARVVERAEGLDGSALAAREELRALTSQAEQARSLLADNLLEAIDQIDRIDAEREKVVSSLGETVETLRARAPEIEQDVGEMERRLETIRGAIDALSSRSTRAAEDAMTLRDEFTRLIESAQREASSFEERAERVGGWLATLITRAEGATDAPPEGASKAPQVKVLGDRAAATAGSPSNQSQSKKTTKKATKKATSTTKPRSPRSSPGSSSDASDAG